jgi:hypothetical protein
VRYIHYGKAMMENIKMGTALRSKIGGEASSVMPAMMMDPAPSDAGEHGKANEIFGIDLVNDKEMDIS